MDPNPEPLTTDQAVELVHARTGIRPAVSTLTRWARRYPGLARRAGPKRLVFDRTRLEAVISADPRTTQAAA